MIFLTFLQLTKKLQQDWEKLLLPADWARIISTRLHVDAHDVEEQKILDS
ncbi:hypothetical protein [Rudaea sp.]